MKKNGDQTKVALLFAAYCLVMLALLLLRSPGERRYFNLIPFKTVREYFAVFLGGEHFEDWSWYFTHINLFGNVVMFVPLGLLLPILFERQRSYGSFLFTVASAVAAVELLQFLLRRGYLDVDDLLLNTLGASLGWLCWRGYMRWMKPGVLREIEDRQSKRAPLLLLITAAIKVVMNERRGKDGE